MNERTTPELSAGLHLETITIRVYPDGRLDTENAGRYLDVRPKTLAMWRVEGTGPRFIKRGKRIFYFLEDLDVWLKQGERVTSTAELRTLEYRLQRGHKTDA